ncbi:MAG: hypothetical protein H6872_01110 [Methylobacteriaceae bacterium]|nr:hypothetical protein [Rhodoblastus sp.]MCC0003801.1 hypothetical protein [Methylobacteriaceae bacterium]
MRTRDSPLLRCQLPTISAAIAGPAAKTTPMQTSVSRFIAPSVSPVPRAWAKSNEAQRACQCHRAAVLCASAPASPPRATFDLDGVEPELCARRAARKDAAGGDLPRFNHPLIYINICRIALIRLSVER